MAEQVVEVGLGILGVYVLIGFIFSIFFVFKGAAKIDPGAQGGTWGFKLLIIPGCLAFWPLLAKRWVRGCSEPPGECSPHRKAAGGCAGCSRRTAK